MSISNGSSHLRGSWIHRRWSTTRSSTVRGDWKIVDPARLQGAGSVRGSGGILSKAYPGFAQVAGPLLAVLQFSPSRLKARKKQNPALEVTYRRFSELWNDECEEAFNELKQRMVSPEILGHPDFEHPFYVETNASTKGMLPQVIEGRRTVIAHASRTLNASEKRNINFSSKWIEFLALKLAILEKFRPYLELSRFIVLTDNQPLSYLKETKLSVAETRWAAAQLAHFDFEVRHKPGKITCSAGCVVAVARWTWTRWQSAEWEWGGRRGVIWSRCSGNDSRGASTCVGKGKRRAGVCKSQCWTRWCGGCVTSAVLGQVITQGLAPKVAKKLNTLRNAVLTKKKN